MTQDNIERSTHGIQNMKRKTNLHKWLVFISSFVVMVFDVGIFYSQGPLFVIIMRRFNSSRTETAVIQSLLISITLGSGIFYGTLIHKFGTRIVGMAGGLVSSAALIVSAFATSTTYLVFSTGIMFGVGVAPCFIGSVTATGQHFVGGKGSSFVLAALSAGGGIGGMMYPYLTQYLDKVYGLPGIYLIIGGIVLHGFPAALLWSPPITQTHRRMNTSQHSTNSISLVNHGTRIPDSQLENGPAAFTTNLNFEINVDCKQKETDKCVNISSTSSESALYNFTSRNVGSQLYEGRIFNVENVHRCAKLYVINNSYQYDNAGFVQCNQDDKTCHVARTELDSLPPLKEFSICSDDNACEHTKKDDARKVSVTPENDLEHSTDIDQDSITTLESLKYLVKQKVFWAYAFGLTLTNPALNLIPMFMVDIFTDIGLTESHASLTLTLLNVFSALGRISIGMLIKIPGLSGVGVPMVAALIAAISILCMVFITSLHGQMVLFCAFGFSLGILVSSFTVTTAEIFGVKHLSNAVGILFTMGSVGNALGGPFGGYIRDTTNSYTLVMFTSSGACCLGCFMFLLSYIWKHSFKDTKRKQSIYVSKL